MDVAGFPDLGLLFDLGPVAVGELDDLAEELLVDLSEDFDADDGEFVGRFGRVGKPGTVPGRADAAAIRYSPGFLTVSLRKSKRPEL